MGVCVTRWALSVVVGHCLRRQIAVVHSFGAVLAGCAPILVDTLRLAFATAHTSTSGPKSGRAHDG